MNTIGPILSEAVTWQWFDTDPETGRLSPGWYSWCDGGPWMPAYLSFRTEWEKAFGWGYQSIMRYWPGEA